MKNRLLHGGHEESASVDHSDSETNTYHGVGIFLIIMAPILGSIFPKLLEKRKNILHFLNAYASGVLLGMSLLHLIPDAISAVPQIQSLKEGYPIATLLVGATILFLLAISTYAPFLTNCCISTLNCCVSFKFTDTLIALFSIWPGLMIHGIFEGLAVGVGVGLSSDWVIQIIVYNKQL